jgi:hypothetical protein
VTDAALALHRAARPLLAAAYGSADARAGEAWEVLLGLQAGLQGVELADGSLRAGVALRLALLMEDRGQLAQAQAVLCKVGLWGRGGSGWGLGGEA